MKFTFPPNSKPLAGYTIKRGIHRGGFGEVYYAHTDGGKEVALKLLQSQLEVELRGVRQCLNLKHPNLVSLFDIRIDDDGDHWIVMEYVAGRNLADVLEQHPDGLPLEDVTAWLEGMAAGLDFLHDRGIVHRDLKPGNVFVENGVVKIGDVGLSKYISQSRRNEQTQSVGTVYYMAPEVAHGRYGREVDVYSLGVVLYEMLTGRVPFEGETTGEILMKHLSEAPDLSIVDPRFRPILAGALEKDPTKRTASATQLARDFSKAAATRAVRVPVYAGAGVGAGGARDGDGTAAPPFPIEDRSLPSPGEASTRPNGGPRVTLADTKPAAGFDWNALLFGFPWPGSTGRDLARWRPWAVVGLLAVLWLMLPETRRSPLRPLCVIAGLVVIVRAVLGRAASAGAAPVATPAPLPPPPRPSAPPQRVARQIYSGGRHRRSELLTPATLRSIPFRQRVSEWSGALAYAAPLTALVAFGLVLATPVLPLGSVPRGVDPGVFGHFALVTLLGSWAVLTSAKFVEGRRVNGLHRRLAYFLVGSLVGLAAFWLHGTLLVELSDGLTRRQPDALVERLPGRDLVTALGQPTLHGYMLFFGLLFAARRWWWHVDGFRPWRFRVWTVAVTGLVGLLLCSVFAFPHVWGALWAASISCVTQLAAPWMSLEDRYALAEERARV